MEIKVIKLRSEAKLPFFGSEAAAGADLYACTGKGEISIAPGETAMAGTGIAAAIPEGYFGGVFARSGLASREGLRPANCVGVIDADYRGEIIVALHNDSDQLRTVHDGDRIAQLVIMPCMAVNYRLSESLDETERGEGGFGHSGLR